MPLDRSAIVDVLKRIHLFRGVDDSKLNIAADMIEQVELAASTSIYKEGDISDYFYIIATGRARISRYIPREQQTMQLGFLEEYDYFGEEVLDSNWPRQINVETVEDTTLLRISVPTFVDMLDLIPPLAQRLQFILDSYKLMLKTRFAWQDPEETVYYIARKHTFFLWLRILPPTAFGTVFLPLSLALYLSNPLLLTFLAVPFLVAVFTVGWWIWSYIDWSNDYYFVTTRRIVYQERVIFFYDSRQESPLDAIQSTQTNTTQWGRWLGYGNVAIRTYIGTILFRSVAMPEQVMALIQDHQIRAQFNVHRTELRTMKGIIDKRIRSGLQPPLPPGPPKPKVRPSATRQFLATMFHLRFESGGTVTFRTHWFILLQKIWAPTLLMLGLLALFFANASAGFELLTVQATCGLLFIFGFMVFLWWLYQYLDWHNDIYLITSDQVVDIYKKPLGSEERQAAPLKNIISIESKRRGFIGLLLNYGTVFIRVGDKQLTFDDVLNPSEVQRELFQRLTARTNADKQAQAESENRRMADWIATYNDWMRENLSPKPNSMPDQNPPPGQDQPRNS